MLADAPDWMDGPARARIEGAIASLGWRTETVAAWLALLARIGGPADADFVDWLRGRSRRGARISTSACTATGSIRRKPFAETVLEPAHGALVTSATLTGGGDWDVAEARTGALHLLRGRQPFRGAQPVRLRAARPRC